MGLTSDGVIDVAVIGAGAAGLTTAVFAARRLPGRSVVAFDGAARLGAKILVAGGGRCNVTNQVVTPADYNGGSPHVIKRVLAAFPVAPTIAFFREIGVELHVEEDGKLFPNSHQARTVLNALLAEADRRGTRVLREHRVTGVCRPASGAAPESGTALDLRIQTNRGMCRARCVVLATGGLSLPKTGSDGLGYRLAESLGHTIVPTTPALAPLVLEGEFHRGLSGISHNAGLTVRAENVGPVRLAGALLWTHFGISGPLALNASRHWLRARREGGPCTVAMNFVPGQTFESLDRRLIQAAADRPRTRLHSALAGWVPARVGEALLADIGLRGDLQLAQLGRDQRRRLVHGLIETPLRVRDSRGYNHAEVTAGGVPLTEIDARTMASRLCPGLFLAGEILDVDGRIGGFNFQWAWSSAWVAARGLAQVLSR